MKQQICIYIRDLGEDQGDLLGLIILCASMEKNLSGFLLYARGQALRFSLY